MFRRHLRSTVILFVIGLIAAACAPEATEGTQEGAGPTRPFVYAHPTTFPDLDPSTGFSNDSVVNSSVYETLVRYNPGSEELVTPVLATDWEANLGSTRWTFTLRHGVKFSDGATLTAVAAKSMIELAMNVD